MGTIEALMGMITMLRLLRDNQDTVSCPDDGGCICDKFDVAIEKHMVIVIELAGSRIRHIEQVDLPEVDEFNMDRQEGRRVWQDAHHKRLLAEQIRLYDIRDEMAGMLPSFIPQEEANEIKRLSGLDDEIWRKPPQAGGIYQHTDFGPIKCRRGSVKF